MGTQLDRHCIEVLHSTSMKDFLRKIVAFSEDRGFGRVSATVHTEHTTNAPTACMPEFEDLGAAHVDLLEDIHLFAAHAQATAFERRTHFDPPAHEQSSLPPGERETLRWAMNGMTRWEIGRQMALSECDIALRLQRVMRKLGCGSTYEAG